MGNIVTWHWIIILLSLALFGGVIFAAVKAAGNHVHRSVGRTEGEAEPAAVSRARQNTAFFGYIAKHWRGQLSLPVSFWLNSLLASLIAFLIVAAINASIAGSLDPVLVLLAIVSMYCILMTITVWQVTGTWRAAENYKKRTGRWGWTVAAQIAVIVVVFQLVKPFTDGMEQIVDFVAIATETDQASAFEVGLKGDSDLHINGYIAFKLVDEFDKYISQSNDIKSVHLSSAGGRLGPALHISNLIRARQINTFADTGCYSACTIVFIGGKDRVVTVGTKLGFHRGSMAGATDADMRSIQAEERNYLLARGVPRSFIRKAYNTPSDRMWYPTYRELMKANIVTHIQVGTTFVPIGEFCRTEECDRFSTAPVWLQKIAASVNLSVPRKIDQSTVFERAISGPRKHFTYLYTLQSDRLKNPDLLSRKIRSSSCADRKMAVLFRNGITMHWKYRGPEGKPLHEITLRPDDCKKYRQSGQ